MLHIMDKVSTFVYISHWVVSATLIRRLEEPRIQSWCINFPSLHTWYKWTQYEHRLYLYTSWFEWLKKWLCRADICTFQFPKKKKYISLTVTKPKYNISVISKIKIFYHVLQHDKIHITWQCISLFSWSYHHKKSKGT